MRTFLLRYILQNQVLSTVLIIVVGWVLFEIREILVVLFISYILMASLSPLVEFLKKRRVPAIVASIFAYLAVLFFLILLIFPLVPFFISQVQLLFKSLPEHINDSARLLNIHIESDQINSYLTSELSTIGKNAFSLTTQVFGGLFSILTVFVLSFYLLIQKDTLRRAVAGFFPKSFEKKVLFTLSRVEEKLGAWLRGQIVLSFSIGLVTWTVLSLLGIPFALPLALLAGILEIAPTIGPILSAIPAVIVALSISPTMALVIVGVYIVIQALENNILVPRIMEKAVGLNPLIILLGVIIGGKLMGISGALLSIPLISLITVIFETNEKVV